MRLGASLSPGILIPGRAGETDRSVLASFGGAEQLLRFLRGLGAESAELRTVGPEDDPGEILGAYEALRKAGLGVTVHGRLTEGFVPFEKAYPSVLPVLERMRSRGEAPLVFTVHALSGKTGDRAELASRTRALLDLWCRDARRLGIRFALEENRTKGICDPGDSAEGVAEMLRGLPEDVCGACFDFGHHYHNVRRAGLPEERPPDPEFLRRTVHTHIHTCGIRGTHMPFGPETRLPLETYLSSLRAAGYDGVLNLELSFERFGDVAPREGLRDSLRRLASASGLALPSRETEREAHNLAAARDAAEGLRAGAAFLRETGPDGFFVTDPAGYVFRAGGVRFGLDTARMGPLAEEELPAWREVLGELDFVLVTHGHEDHWDARLFRASEDLPCRWYLPEKLFPGAPEDPMFSGGRAVFLRAGERIALPGAEIRTFEGCHFSQNMGLEELQFLVAAGGRRIYFPADVRDWGLDRFPAIEEPDAMFLNMYMGRGMALAPEDTAAAEAARFAADFRPKRLYLAHVWDGSREPGDIWTWTHCGQVMDALEALLPGVPVTPLRLFSRHFF